MIKAILFDLGDVLISNSFDSVLQEISDKLGIDFSDLKSLEAKYKEKLLIGELSIFDYGKILKEEFNLSLSQEKIFLVWGEAYKKTRVINRKLYDFSRDLKKNYIVGMISNIYDLPEKIDRERGIFDIFDPCILSCKVGLAKPDKRIFKLALKELKFEPENCVFVDNRECHLLAASELDMETVLFKNNEQVIEDLNKLLGS